MLEGECIEINDLIKKYNPFKRVFVRLICRFSSLFGDTEYDKCIYNYLK